MLLNSHLTIEKHYPLLAKTLSATRQLPLEEALAKKAKYNLPFSVDVKASDLSTDLLSKGPMEVAQILETAGYKHAPGALWQPDTSVNALDSLASHAANSPIHKALLSQTIETLHKEQPQAALEWINAQPSEDERGHLAAAILGTWGPGYQASTLIDLVNLIDLDQISKEDRSLGHRVRSKIRGVGETMAAQDPEAAIQLVAQFKDDRTRTSSYRTLAKIWFEHDEQATLDWLRSLPSTDREATVEHSSILKEALTR